MPFIMDMDANDGEDYNNSHRALLQAFFARGTMTFEQARPVLAACMTAQDQERETLPNDITEADLNTYLTALNTTISPFDFEVRSTLSQHAHRTRIYALVNTTSDSITQLATTSSPDEIAYVKRLLDAIFTKKCTRRHEVFAIKGIEALNLNKEDKGNNRQSNGVNGNTVIHSDDEDGAPQPQPGQVRNITMHQAETMLQSLVAEGWFECSRKKYYSLAPRALMELRVWLTQTYNDDEDEGDAGVQRVKFCAACREIVTIGQRCADLDCLGRLHDGCTATMWRSMGGRERCPICRKSWENHGFVGEKAETEAGRRSSAANVVASSSRAPHVNGVAATNGDHEEDDDDSADAEGQGEDEESDEDAEAEEEDDEG